MSYILKASLITLGLSVFSLIQTQAEESESYKEKLAQIDERLALRAQLIAQKNALAALKQKQLELNGQKETELKQNAADLKAVKNYLESFAKIDSSSSVRYHITEVGTNRIANIIVETNGKSVTNSIPVTLVK